MSNFIIFSNTDQDTNMEYFIIEHNQKYAINFTQKLLQLYKSLESKDNIPSINSLTLYKQSEVSETLSDPFIFVYKIWND